MSQKKMNVEDGGIGLHPPLFFIVARITAASARENGISLCVADLKVNRVERACAGVPRANQSPLVDDCGQFDLYGSGQWGPELAIEPR
jgi:hypothetical protein